MTRTLSPKMFSIDLTKVYYSQHHLVLNLWLDSIHSKRRATVERVHQVQYQAASSEVVVVEVAVAQAIEAIGPVMMAKAEGSLDQKGLKV